jgi:hypothetical protein
MTIDRVVDIYCRVISIYRSTPTSPKQNKLQTSRLEYLAPWKTDGFLGGRKEKHTSIPPNLAIPSYNAHTHRSRGKLVALVGVEPEELVCAAAVFLFESLDADLCVDGGYGGGGGCKRGRGRRRGDCGAEEGCKTQDDDEGKHVWWVRGE